MPHSSCLASGLPAMQGLACRGANGLFAGSARGDAPRHGREPAAPDSAATSSQCSNRSSVRHGHWRHSTVGHRGGRGAARRVPGGEGQSVNLSMGRTRTRVPLWSTTTGAPDARSTSCCFYKRLRAWEARRAGGRRVRTARFGSRRPERSREEKGGKSHEDEERNLLEGLGIGFDKASIADDNAGDQDWQKDRGAPVDA